MQFDTIICDEVHKLCNVRTKTYKAIQTIKATRKIGASATPIVNRAEDLFGVINWIRPGVLGSYYSFVNRYCVKDSWGSVKGYRNMAELARRVAPFIIRKTLEEANLQLPDKVVTDIPITLDSKEQSLYDLIKKELLFDIERQDISKIQNPVQLQNTIVKLGKLFELCDSMELIGDSNKSSKLDALKEHLEDSLYNGNKAIIITKFERMARILERELGIYRPLVITGGTNDRQEILERFKAQKEHKILIGTEAISQGLNLQVANILYNYDLPWNPARLEQREGRIHRQGQDKPVFIYNLVVDHGVEQWLLKKIKAKAELSSSLLPKTINDIKEILQ